MGDPNARRQRELQEREKWLFQIAAILDEAAMPLALAAPAANNYQFIMRSAGMGRRAATLRRRVNDWHPIRHLSLFLLGRPFPSSVSDIRQLLDHLRDAEVSLYRLQSFASALAFLETAGGRTGESALHSHSMVRGLVCGSIGDVATRASPS